MLTADQAMREVQGLKGRCCKRKQADAQRKIWVTINRSFCNDREEPCAFLDVKLLLCLYLEFEIRNLRRYLLTAAKLERQRCWGRGSTERYKKDKRYNAEAEALGVERQGACLPSSVHRVICASHIRRGTVPSYRNKCLACATCRVGTVAFSEARDYIRRNGNQFCCSFFSFCYDVKSGGSQTPKPTIL
jgi:hypothetical protein